MNMKKVSAIIAIIWIVGASLLAAFTVISWTVFWYVAAVVALFAWFVMPRMK